MADRPTGGEEEEEEDEVGEGRPTKRRSVGQEETAASNAVVGRASEEGRRRQPQQPQRPSPPPAPPLDAADAEPPRRSINLPGRPPEAGVIKSIYMENFMCHQKLRINLCRNVNFITGQNGSG